MVSTCSWRSKAHATQVLESCPPEKRTKARLFMAFHPSETCGRGKCLLRGRASWRGARLDHREHVLEGLEQTQQLGHFLAPARDRNLAGLQGRREGGLLQR